MSRRKAPAGAFVGDRPVPARSTRQRRRAGPMPEPSAKLYRSRVADQIVAEEYQQMDCEKIKAMQQMSFAMRSPKPRLAKPRLSRFQRFFLAICASILAGL